MKEKGFIIFEDGMLLPFGIYTCPDEVSYLDTPTHEEDFIREVVPSIVFKFFDHTYNKDESFYQNAINLSLEGIFMIINNQKEKNGPSEILVYAPQNPTEEQLNTLKDEERILNIDVQEVCEYQSCEIDDYLNYDNLTSYIKTKSEKRPNIKFS